MKAKKPKPVAPAVASPVSAWRFWLVPLLVLFAAAPLGYRYFYFLTQLPQYEFTVVFLLAWLGIVVIRRKEYFADAPRASRLGTALGVAAFLSLVAGVLIGSSWFVYLALILGVGALFSFVGDWSGAYPLFPVWASLLIPLRPPLGYDQTALNRLRLIASEGASRIADLLQVPHLLQGNVFYLADKEMFMDDACSGIISLLTCMACAALIAIWRRRGTLHFLLLVAAGGFWAVIFNILRVEALLCAWHWFSFDLTSGWKHDALGYVALTGSALCLVASDIGVHWMLQDTSEIRSVFTQFWNVRIANPSAGELEPAVRAASAWSQVRANFRLERRHLVVALVLVGLIVSQTPRELKAWNLLGGKSKNFIVSEIVAAPLPESFGEWRHTPEKDAAKFWRLDHEIKSTQATYQRGKEVMVVAVAYPYNHWHDVTACYELGNWKIGLRSVPAETMGIVEQNPTRDAIMHLEMHRGEVENATVLFAFVDPTGEPIRAPRSAKNLNDAMKHRFGFDQETNPDFKGFLVQVLWPRTSAQQSDDEFKEQLALFEKILDQIRVDWTRPAEDKP